MPQCAMHPVIGIGLSTVPAGESDLATPAGAVIRSVQPGGPADKAGLRTNDRITSIDGRSVKQPGDVVSAIERRGVGADVTIGVLRGEETITVKVRAVDLRSLAKR